MTVPLATQRLSFPARLRATARACARDAAASMAAIAGLGALACVACCALPLILAAGGLTALAAGASAVAGTIEPYLALGVGVLALAVPLGVWAKGAVGPSTDPAAGGCQSACATDGSCGCRTTGPALACTLAPGAVEPRAAELRAVFAAHTGTARPGDRELALSFDAAAIDAVKALAERERACCAFLESEVVVDGGSVTWTLRGPAGSEPALALFESLPRRVAAGLTDEEARALLAEMNRALRG